MKIPQTPYYFSYSETLLLGDSDNKQTHADRARSNSCLGSRWEVMRETRARSDAVSRAFHATSPNDYRDKSYVCRYRDQLKGSPQVW